VADRYVKISLDFGDGLPGKDGKAPSMLEGGLAKHIP